MPNNQPPNNPEQTTPDQAARDRRNARRRQRYAERRNAAQSAADIPILAYDLEALRRDTLRWEQLRESVFSTMSETIVTFDFEEEGEAMPEAIEAHESNQRFLTVVRERRRHTSFNNQRRNLMLAYGCIDSAVNSRRISHVLDYLMQARSYFHYFTRNQSLRQQGNVCVPLRLLRGWEQYNRRRSEPLGPDSVGEMVRCAISGEEWPEALCFYDEQGDEYFGPDRYGELHRYDWPMRRAMRYEPDFGDDDEYPEWVSDRGARLLAYNASPSRVLGREYWTAQGEPQRPNTRYFGVEVECVFSDINAISEAMIQARKLPKIAIFKEDGSLPYGGAEICSLPMTRRGAADLAPLLDMLVTEGARAWNRTQCGLHVHVSRASASWLTWGKVERFFGNTANQEFLTKVAGRAPNNYCYRDVPQRYNPRTGENELQTGPMLAPVKLTRAKLKADRQDNRYFALNFATHKPTVEFRMFRGNVKFAGVMRAIEFCDAIIDYAAQCSNRSTMDYRDFMSWLERNAEIYPIIAKTITGISGAEIQSTEYAA